MPPRKHKYSQAELLPLLKLTIDSMMGLEKTKDLLTTHKKAWNKNQESLWLLMSEGDCSSRFIMHNIGVKRRDWLMRHLTGE